MKRTFRSRGWPWWVWRRVANRVGRRAHAPAPTALVAASVTAGTNLGNVKFNFTTSADANNARVHVYRVPAGGTLDKAIHQRIVIPASPGSSFSHNYGDTTRTNQLADPGFDTAIGAGTWSQSASTWSIAGGQATAGGGTSSLRQSIAVANVPYRIGLNVKTFTSGTVRIRYGGGSTSQVVGPTQAAVGWYLQTLTPNADNNLFEIVAQPFGGVVDDAVMYQQTAACAPAGAWDFYAFPANAYGAEGPGAAAITNVVII